MLNNEKSAIFFSNEEQLTILRSLSQYGSDLAEIGADTKVVLKLIRLFTFNFAEDEVYQNDNFGEDEVYQNDHE